jgi:pimeloyl-ACP methyl ester carboxylesterase
MTTERVRSHVSMHYKEYAAGVSPSGPPLVLVHGAGGDLMHWPTDLRRLPGRRVYAIDLPGHGKTGGSVLPDIGAYAEAVNAWVAERGLPRFVLAGHSMGGAIALELALRHPARAAGLVLLSTGARLRVSPQILAGIQNDFGATVALLVKWMYGEAADPNLLRLGARRLREVQPEVLHADFAACDAFDRRADVSRITVPALVMCGDADVMTPLRSSEFLRDQIAGAELVVIPGAGHMAALQQPQLAAREVERFLGALATRQHTLQE